MRFLFVILLIAALSGRSLAESTAEELFDEGQRAYDRSDWSTAIENWQRAYDVSGKAGLLFNLGQAYRLAGDCALALTNYKRFVELVPQSEQKSLADDFIRELEPTCGAPKQTPIFFRPKARPDRTLKLVGLVSGGAGTIVLAVGLGFGHRASTLGDRVTAACSTSCDWAAQRDTDAAGRRAARTGYVLDVIGLAGVAGGAVLYYLGHRATAVTVAPRPRDGGALLSWSRSW